jgi:hypothetical protein
MKNIGVEVNDNIGDNINDFDVFKTSTVTGSFLPLFPIWKKITLDIFETTQVSVEAPFNHIFYGLD